MQVNQNTYYRTVSRDSFTVLPKDRNNMSEDLELGILHRIAPPYRSLPVGKQSFLLVRYPENCTSGRQMYRVWA